jgi:anti-anti-sigma factor
MSLSELRPQDQALLEIEVRPDGASVTITLEGDLDLSTVASLRTVFDSLDQGYRQVVLDLSDVAFVDSMGLGLLVEARRRFEPEFRELALRAPSEHVRQVLEITGLEQILPIID